MQPLQDAIFTTVLKNKTQIITAFKCFYWLILIIIVLGAYSIATNGSQMPFFYEIGVNAGRASIIFFAITLLPGMMRRFGITNKILTSIMTLRRYFGISVYMLALLHFMIVRFIFHVMQYGLMLPQLMLFEVMGFMALNMLFLLFLTSNNFSVAKLGIWWKRLHSLVYVIVWLIFLHVALMSISVWTILIGLTALAEVTSLIFAAYKKNQSKSA